MVRTIVQLTESQSQGLRERAKERGVSVSELVRQGVDVILRSQITDAEMRQRARNAVGFAPDVPDLSEDHDRYLADAFADRSAS